MTEFGLKPEGFQRMRLDDTRALIVERVIDELGQTVNTDPDSVLGQMISVVAFVSSRGWELAEHIYNSTSPSTAEGVQLDLVASIIGVKRLESTRSRVLASVRGDQGTLIPAGSQVAVAETGELFSNPQSGIITRSNALSITCQVNIVQAGGSYTVVINGTPFIYEAGPDPTPTTIAQGVVSEINGGTEPVLATHIEEGQFEVNTVQDDLAFNTITSANLIITSRASPLLFRAVETGPIAVLAGTFTEIVTPVAGWESVTNLEPGVLGRNQETDIELRQRRGASTRLVGAGSVEAIQARLRQNVQDVRTAIVYENREPYTVSGRPPHSFEAIVVGGDNTEIAAELWAAKPAGIETHGNESVLITDSNGDLQQIKFSRPVPVYIWVECNVEVIGGAFPAEGLEAVKLAILNRGNEFKVGESIIYQQFFGPIYGVPGITLIELKLAKTADETPPVSYTADNISLTEVEVSSFSLDRISVGFLNE